jgi:hypothetical protein
MVMGGGVATFIRKWFFKRYRNVSRWLVTAIS